MKLLVTGGAGFSNFIRHILAKYPTYSVINYDKLTYAGNLDNLRDIEKNKNYRFVKGDISDQKKVARVVQGVDVVINFAAETHVDRSIMAADSFIETDVRGTYVLLEAVKKHKTGRYIQISTDEVYGSINKGSFTESSQIQPNSPYASSKAGGDLLVHSYFVTYGLPVIITRSSNNFGPYQYPEKVIPLFVTNALQNKPLPLYGNGINIRDWLYVMDNCEAIDAVLHKGKTGQVYNIGGGNEVTNSDLTAMILQTLGKPATLIQRVKDRPGHDLRYSLSCAKIKRELGWKPRTNFRTTLQETIAWYKENEWWWKKLKDEEYRKYYKKQYKTV